MVIADIDGAVARCYEEVTREDKNDRPTRTQILFYYIGSHERGVTHDTYMILHYTGRLASKVLLHYTGCLASKVLLHYTGCLACKVLLHYTGCLACKVLLHYTKTARGSRRGQGLPQTHARGSWHRQPEVVGEDKDAPDICQR